MISLGNMSQLLLWTGADRKDVLFVDAEIGHVHSLTKLEYSGECGGLNQPICPDGEQCTCGLIAGADGLCVEDPAGCLLPTIDPGLIPPTLIMFSQVLQTLHCVVWKSICT